MSFEKIKNKFWKSESQYGQLKALTPETLDAAENQLGVKMPEELITLLNIQNGGYINIDFNACAVSTPNSWAEDHITFDALMGIEKHADYTTILDTEYLLQEWNMPSGLVLLSGDGHYWVALDYRKKDEPEVIYYETDTGKEILLADTFKTFVEKLQSENDFRIEE